MQAAATRERLWWWVAVGAIALLGFVLRLLAARGGLWTDEAWSMIYAVQAHDPAGVFLRINHDNNHHLNSLWLQTIGPAAPPILARLPAVIAGSLCAILAAMLAGRHSRAAGLVAGLLFAVSPVLVAFGSEARGYAPMLLAALILLLLVDRLLDGRAVRGACWWIALVTLFGMFSHLTMAAPVAIASLWYYAERRAADGPETALAATLRLMGPAIGVVGAVILFVFAAAATSRTGMQTAGYDPFSRSLYLTALDDLALWSAGLRTPWPWVAPLAIGAAASLVAWRRPQWLGSRARLYALLIISIPLGIVAMRAGNSGYARFYLMSAVGLLLLLSEWIARGLSSRADVRSGAALLAVTLVGVSLYRDAELIAVDRGRPSAPVEDMAALSPAGARVAFAGPRFKAVVAVAAERIGYRARFAGGCTPADFLLAAQPLGRPTPWRVVRCGIAMEAIDSSITSPLTGDSWVLYRPATLQSLKAADSGPPPGARNRRLSGRAGVAQG